MKRSLLLLVVAVWLAGCSSGSTVEEDTFVPVDMAEQDTNVSCLGTPCDSVLECDAGGPCTAKISCLDGCCVYELLPEGTPCDDGCNLDGTCTAGGECTGTPTVMCEEEDGNPCTAPTCNPETGKCGDEVPVADGTKAMDSYCWDGLVCKDGELDESEAVPSALATQCETQDQALDPFGCVAKVFCVDSEPQCMVEVKDEGTECWTAGGGKDETCVGHACNVDGECVVDDAFSVSCTEEYYPEQCDDACRACTEMTCHWIEDLGDETPDEMIKYCQVSAIVGEECSDGNDCTEGDLCVLSGQTDGPLGKETLGSCEPGEGKTKEECLEEMEMPLLPCLKAGITCSEEEGCALNQDDADAWCAPPEALCYHKGQTYCSHVDVGDGKWNEETGCHLVVLDEDGCADGNTCTDDVCDYETGCVNEPLDGPECDDGNDVTILDSCVEGECKGLPDPDDDGIPNAGFPDFCQSGNAVDCTDNCPDVANPAQEDSDGDGQGDACSCDPDCAGKQCGPDGCGGSCGECADDNPCTEDICLDAGLCSYPPTNEGLLCVKEGLCVGKCSNGLCAESAVETCNGKDDDCDDLIDEDPNLCQAGWSCQNGECVEDCVPVDGGWSDWSCGACSADCGGGTMTCTRSCNNPPPSCGGQVCSGGAGKTEACNTQACVNYLPTGTTSYSQGEQVITGVVPNGKTSIQFKLWGGGGAGGFPGNGGGGAYVAGTVTVQPGDNIELRVAGGGKSECSGGGATYVFKNGQVVMIAAGGGGAGSDGSHNSQNLPPTVAAGGGGGPLNGSGQAGTETTYLNTNSGGGGGGSQASGGAGGISNNQSQYDNCTLNGEAGSAHTGGRNGTGQCNWGGAASYEKGGSTPGGNGTGGGGGAGYYGGGSGAGMWTYSGGGGGGGSSWISHAHVSGSTSEGGNYQTPGGTGIGGYTGAAGRGGAAGDYSNWPAVTIQPEDGKPGLIIMVL